MVGVVCTAVLAGQNEAEMSYRGRKEDRRAGGDVRASHADHTFTRQFRVTSGILVGPTEIFNRDEPLIMVL